MTESWTSDSLNHCRPARRIVVVGPCASGKSSLVTALRERGYDAHAAAQEHSIIATLWRNQNPDVLIALQADISTVRERRGYQWPEWLHEVQAERLREAVTAADLVIDTSRLDAGAVADRAIAFLDAITTERRSIAREPASGVGDDNPAEPSSSQ